MGEVIDWDDLAFLNVPNCPSCLEPMEPVVTSWWCEPCQVRVDLK